MGRIVETCLGVTLIRYRWKTRRKNKVELLYCEDIEIGEKKEINTDKYKDSNRTISIFIRDRKSKKIVSEEVENKK